jgi:hypothetical protein
MTQIAAVDHGETHERWVASIPTASAKAGVGSQSANPGKKSKSREKDLAPVLPMTMR